MEAAAARVVRGKDPVRRDLRRKVRHLMTITGPAHKITDSPRNPTDDMNPLRNPRKQGIPIAPPTTSSGPAKEVVIRLLMY